MKISFISLLCFFVQSVTAQTHEWKQIPGSSVSTADFFSANPSIDIIWGYDSGLWKVACRTTCPETLTGFVPLETLSAQSGYWTRWNTTTQETPSNPLAGTWCLSGYPLSIHTNMSSGWEATPNVTQLDISETGNVVLGDEFRSPDLTLTSNDSLGLHSNGRVNRVLLKENRIEFDFPNQFGAKRSRFVLLSHTLDKITFLSTYSMAVGFNVLGYMKRLEPEATTCTIPTELWGD